MDPAYQGHRPNPPATRETNSHQAHDPVLRVGARGWGWRVRRAALSPAAEGKRRRGAWLGRKWEREEAVAEWWCGSVGSAKGGAATRGEGSGSALLVELPRWVGLSWIQWVEFATLHGL